MFKVKRNGLDASPLLSNLLTHHSRNGWYIMSPMLSSLDADNFQPIGEYIDRGEYHPNILDDGTVHVRLEGDLTPEMLRHEIVRCGTIYQVAQMLEMPGLQDLSFRKLLALAPHYQALEILTVIELVFDVGSPEIRQYLTRYVADHYYSLVLSETEKTVKVMVANEDLAKGVFGKLSGREEDIKIETVKEEGKETDETKDEANVDDAVEGNLVKDQEGPGKQDNKEENTDEAVDQTEEGMVKMDLRKSDTEQTEEDLVNLVPKQSDAFEAF